VSDDVGPDGKPVLSARDRVLISRARPMSITSQLGNILKVQDWIGEGLSPRMVAYRAQQEFEVSRVTANRYVATALALLQRDGAMEPQDSKRARIVRMLEGQIKRALELKRTAVSDGQPYEYDSPDLKAANQAIALLMQLEGIGKP
jgi:hypothetical protein